MSLLFLCWSIIAPVFCMNFQHGNHMFKSYGTVGDYVDFDGDGQLEMISYMVDVSSNKSTIYISSIKRAVNDEESVKYCTIDGIVVGLMSSNFNNDSTPDVLLVMKDSKTSYYLVMLFQEESTRELVPGWDSRQSLEEAIAKVKKDSPHGLHNKEKYIMDADYQKTSIQPLLADLNGDGFLDILVQTLERKIFVWCNFGFALLPFLIEHVPFCKFTGTFNGWIPSPHSSAFVDINGDCRADLALILQKGNESYVSVWLASYDSGEMVYAPMNVPDIKETLTLPRCSGQVSFVDMNGDGTVDIVVPYCAQFDDEGSPAKFCAVKISYNEQIPLCKYIWRNRDGGGCRSPTELCTPSSVKFNSIKYTDPAIALPKELVYVGNWSSPVTLAIGDLNSNGYPDISMIVRNTKTGEHSVEIYKNSDTIPNSIHRKFEKAGSIGSIHGSDGLYISDRVSIVDAHEEGKNDVLVFSHLNSDVKASSSGTVHGIRLYGHYYSPLPRDKNALFMRAYAKTVVSKDSYYVPSEKFPPHAFDVRGPTFKITVIDINGVKYPRISTLRSQSAHTPLQIPYVFFGLGRTNNYVEEFYLGMPSRNKASNNKWISIIPNCSVLATVYPLSNPNEWRLKLSICPSKSIYTILIATLGCLAVLGIFILGFDLREKREDSEQEKGFRQKFIIN